MPKNALCRKENLHTPVILNGQAVITTKVLADAYEATEKHIQQNFNNNQEKFEEGKHYILLQGNELKEFKRQFDNIEVALGVSKYASQLYLWTERGANRHCKILDTDKAWEQFDYLEEVYFKVKEKTLEIQKQESNHFITEHVKVLLETLTEKVNRLEAQAKFNHRPSHATKLNWNKVIKTYAKCPADEENIKHIVFARFGISKWEDLTSDKFSEVFGYIREIAEKANLINQVSLFDGDKEKGV